MADLKSNTLLIIPPHHACHSCRERQLLSDIKTHLPGSIYYATVQKVKRLKDQYDEVTNRIAVLQRKTEGFFGAVKNALTLAKLRNQLQAIKMSISNWLYAVHCHFLGSV